MAQATAHFVQRHVGWGGGVMPAILMYHSVSPYSSDPYQITVSPSRFGLVGLTFDDGYSDFMHYALLARGSEPPVSVLPGLTGHANLLQWLPTP